MPEIPHSDAIAAAYRTGALVDPVLQDADGLIVVTWPNGRGPCVASPELVEDWAWQVNQLRAQVAALRSDSNA